MAEAASNRLFKDETWPNVDFDAWISSNRAELDAIVQGKVVMKTSVLAYNVIDVCVVRLTRGGVMCW